MCGRPHYTAADAVAAFRVAYERRTPEALAEWLAPLADADGLACYCPEDEACHADVLLEWLDRYYPREAQ